MHSCLTENLICLGSLAELDPVKTFECGQCFRWNADENGVYTGVAGGRAASVTVRDGQVYIKTTSEDFDTFWRDYFDLDLDYESIRLSFDAGDYLRECSDFGAGIRILHQDRWEALCSFIISQCNNIPRIKKIVETLCRCFGQAIEYDGEVFYTFPDAQTVAGLTESDLAPLRCGYRAAYIIGAAKAVASGEIDLDALAKADIDTAMKALLSLNGVGAKVANCAVLFGLGHMEAFPVDVWMKRALKEHFPPDFDPKTLGPYAGLAQQYIFYFARSGGKT
jgi:N-glycosylase/DNA lyase